MTCLEARNDFPALWRGTLEPERRDELLAHLAECAQCDKAFRSFALSAPVLYSEPVLINGADESKAPRDWTFSGGTLGMTARWRRRLAMSVAASILLAAGFAAYVAVSAPPESLEDAVANFEPVSELTGHAPPAVNRDVAL